MASTKKSWSKSQLKKFSNIFFQFLSLILIVSGVTLIYFSTADTFAQPILEENLESVERELSLPVRLYIPKISKNLLIEYGVVVDNRWSVSANGVSFLATSVTPAEVGNSVIYGHNRQEILGDLPQLTSGDLIYVLMDDGEMFEYRVYSKQEIKPTQVEILEASEKEKLTIYTCSGFLDTSRFVVTATR